MRSGAVGAYDPDALAYFDWALITDEAVKAAVNQLVFDLKAASLWDAYDVLIPFANQDSTAACFNLKKNDHHATIVNACSFTQYEGFTGNSSNMALDIDYNFTTDMEAASAINYGLSSYIRNSRTTNTDFYHCAIGALAGAPNFFPVQIMPWGGQVPIGNIRNRASACAAGDNQIASTTPNGSQGLHQISRTGANASEYHINGVLRGTSAAAGDPLPNGTVGVLCQKLFTPNNSRAWYSGDQTSLAAIRRGFTGMEAAGETVAFKAYMAAFGKDVLP